MERNLEVEIQKEDQTCPCCLSRSARTFQDASHLAVFCDACDHIWYKGDGLQVSRNIYENSYKYDSYYVGKPPFLWYHRKSMEYLQRTARGKRVLDFGCFDGFFTAKLRTAGFDVYGCDWNRKALEYGRNTYGLSHRLCSEPEGQYDAIVALEVIEHFPDPNDFFDIVLPHLSSEGALIISCPNKNSIYRPKTDAPPHHFSRFSEKSLAGLLARHGFEVEIHEREMSTFQLLRNFIGDSLRRKSSPLRENAESKTPSAPFLDLRLLANAMASSANLILRPVDVLMYRLGFSYFSQFVVAKHPSAAEARKGYFKRLVV